MDLWCSSCFEAKLAPLIKLWLNCEWFFSIWAWHTMVSAACKGWSLLSQVGGGHPNLFHGDITSFERHQEGLGPGGVPHLQLYHCDVRLEVPAASWIRTFYHSEPAFPLQVVDNK